MEAHRHTVASLCVLALLFGFLACLPSSASARTVCNDDDCCSNHSASCSDCMGFENCAFCSKNTTTKGPACHYYPSVTKSPPDGQCSLDNWHIWTGSSSLSCKVSEQTLVIVIASLAGAVIVIVGLACWCWCRRRTRRRREKAHDEYEKMIDYPTMIKENSDRSAARQNYREKYADMYQKYGIASKV